jgi:hypothetical protein
MELKLSFFASDVWENMTFPQAGRGQRPGEDEAFYFMAEG